MALLYELASRNGDGEMNLTELFETQKKLDVVIINKKNLQGEKLLNKNIRALLTELGELSNEERSFKYWSNDRKPRTSVTMFERHGEGPITRNLVLEEYVDSFGLILTIGNELGQSAWIETIEHYIYHEPYKTNDVTIQFNYVFSFAVKIREHYKPLFSCFIALGEMLGFTPKQIEQAYYDKNKINHERQENGY